MLDFFLPPELREELERLRAQINLKAKPLEDSASGRDVLAAVNDMQSSVARELKLYSRAIGARQFVARLYIFREVRKGSRGRWEPVDVVLAEPEFVPGGPEHLRAVMSETLGVLVPESKGMAFWVHSTHGPDVDGFFMLARHSNGFEAALTQHGGQCTELQLSEAAITQALSDLMRPRESRLKPWRQVIKSLTSIVDVDLREDFAEYSKQHAGRELTDDAWSEFISMVFHRRSFLLFMHEIGRITSAPVLDESGILLKTLVALDEKTAQMEKAHTRAMTRFKADLARERATKDVLTKRIKQVEREAQESRKQLKLSGAGPTNVGLQQSVGLALDRFFS
jgi:hypothetical protein